ncbi:MAG: hypothetical protein ABEL97_08325 [Salinibacter sp.]
MTALFLPRLRSRGAQALSLLLVLVVGLQALPLRSVVHHVQRAATHHESAHHGCAHPKGVCPMNPGGPCECDHDHDRTPPDEPTLRSCSGPSTSGLPPAVSGKWVPVPSSRIPSPSVIPTLPRAAPPDVLSPQRAGTDIFRPPRPQPPTRRA